MRGDRSPALVGRPEATQMHDLVVMDQAQRQAGNVIGLHLFTHIRIDPGQIRSASMRRSGDGKCRQRYYYEQKRTEEDITWSCSIETHVSVPSLSTIVWYAVSFGPRDA